MDRIDELCDRGTLREVIIPPFWIVKPATSSGNKKKHNPAADTAAGATSAALRKRSRNKSKKVS